MRQTVFLLLVLIFMLLSTPVNLIAQDQEAQNLAPMVIEERGTGPYKAVALGEETLLKFTIYRPKNLDDFGPKQKLPILLW